MAMFFAVYFGVLLAIGTAIGINWAVEKYQKRIQYKK